MHYVEADYLTKTTNRNKMEPTPLSAVELAAKVETLRNQVSVHDLSFVMIATRNDRKLLLLNGINQTMGIINSPGPKPGQTFFQWLGFANPFKRGSQGILNQLVNSLQCFFVLGLPVFVIRPSLSRP